MKKTTLNVNELKKYINFEPHDKQLIILANQKRFTIIDAGRRFGKSILCAYLVMRELWRDDRHVWVVAPTYDLAKKVWAYLVKWIATYFPDGYFKINYSSLTIQSKATGSWFICKSAENPDGLIGESLDLLIIDEAARIDERIWQSYLRPCLSDRQGKAVFISTPSPVARNWFWQLWLKGQDENNQNYISFKFKTLDNKTIPNLEQDVAEAKASLPEKVFLREYEGDFEEGADKVFRGVHNCIRGREQEPTKDGIYVMGIDLGRMKSYTVLTVIDRLTHHVVSFDRFKTVPWGLQKKRIKALADKYNNALILVDSTGIGDPIYEDLIDMNLSVEDYRFTNKSKRHLIDKLSIFIQQQKVTFPDIKPLIGELEVFSYQITDKGNITYVVPTGFDSDCVMSLALAIWDLPNERPDEADPQIVEYQTNDY